MAKAISVNAKREICTVYRKFSNRRLHAIIWQPMSNETFDRANYVDGFMIYEGPENDVRIAALPHERGINHRILGCFEKQEGIEFEQANIMEFPFFEALRRGILAKDHRISLLESQRAAGKSIREIIANRDNTNDTVIRDLSPIDVWVKDDNDELPQTLAAIEKSGLARQETLAALKFVAIELFKHEVMKVRHLQAKLQSVLIANTPH